MFFDDKKFLGQKIQFFRRKKGLTQFELAEKVGLSEKHLSKIESGIHQPSLAIFFKMIDELDVSLDEFGVNCSPSLDSSKNEMLKLIYSATDSEVKFLFPVIQSIFLGLNKIKKKG